MSNILSSYHYKNIMDPGNKMHLFSRTDFPHSFQSRKFVVTKNSIDEIFLIISFTEYKAL